MEPIRLPLAQILLDIRPPRKRKLAGVRLTCQRHMEILVSKRSAVVLGFAAVLITGCATSGPGAGFSDEIPQSEFEYFSPQASPEVENSFVVEERFEVVWDRIMENASGRMFWGDEDNRSVEALVFDPPFKVESADKEEGRITLSYNFDDATQYVDCGQSHRTFDFQDEFEEYKYPTASDVSFKEMSTWKSKSEYKPAVLEVQRNTELEGVIEVSVTPREAVTDLQVEATYNLVMFFRNALKKYSSMDGQIVGGWETIEWKGQELPSEEFSPFITDESATKTFYEGTAFEITATCVPKGDLEARVFEMAES